MPCASPLDFEGVKVNCQKCDYCVGRRVTGWCARAMMEKDCFPHAFALTLTYGEDTLSSRLGAQTFIYRHVIDFNKRLRRFIEYDHGIKDAAYSFIVAGEMGDRYKRCHWHMIIFSQVDLCKVGVWKDHHGREVNEFADILSPVGKGYNRTWDKWSHGFVVVQAPDYGGIRYAMAYALKDQFNIRNAQGQAREAKAEVFSVGMFRMSKKPPIGARFIDRLLSEYRAARTVPPSRRIVVPGLRARYFPTGLLGDRYLAGLAEINSEIRAETGRDAAGWSSLIYEARLNDKDLELLGVYDGDEDGEDTEADFDVEAQILSGRSRDNEAINAVRQRAAQIVAERKAERRRCYSTEACTLCIRGRGETAYGVEWVGDYPARPGETTREFQTRQNDASRQFPHPWCGIIRNCGQSEMQAAT